MHRSRSAIVALVTSALIWGGAGAARATHFDGVTATGSFDPQFTATIGETRASRPGDINFKVTQADHEDPPVVTTFRTPPDWQYTFEFIRRGQRSNGQPATRCNDTINNRNNSPDRVGTPGGSTDFSKRGDAFIARGELIGSSFLSVHADTFSRPAAPITFRGSIGFVSYDSATSTANLCLLLTLIQSGQPDHTTSNNNVQTFADPVPGNGRDDVEGVTEISADFQLTNVGSSWETIIDLSSTLKDSTLQTLNVSLLEFRANFFGMTVGNWNTEGAIPFARAPGVSGQKTFTAIFQTCPQNDPSYGNCKSDEGQGSGATTGGTVTRNVNVSITPAPGINVPLNNASCTESVQILGAGDPGSLIRLSEGATPLADVTADASGRWSLRRAFTPGAHSIKASMIAPPGPDSETITFTVGLLPPAITSPGEAEVVEPGSVVIVGTSPAGTRTAKLYLSTDPNVPVGQGGADDAGGWSVPITLSPRTTPTLTATATNLCGEGATSAPRTFSVTTVRPVFISPASGSAVNTTDVSIFGSSEPGATVTIFEAGAPVGSTVAAVTGIWNATVPLAEGSHELSARAALGGFESFLQTGYSIEVDLTPPAVPVVTSPADGSTLEPSVLVTGTAEPGSTVVLLEGTNELGRTVTAADGSWAKQVVFELGVHSFQAKAIDRATNESPLSEPVTLTITDPTKILSPAEGAYYPKTVPMEFVASPNAKQIYVYEGDVEIFHASLLAGRWKGPLQFSPGAHEITARARNADGTYSDPTDPRSFIVDGTKPVVTVGSAIPVGLASTALTGTATDNAAFDSGVAKVVISYKNLTGGSTIQQTATCTGCTGATVTWTAIPSSVLRTNGVYEATITSIDAVGNVSASQKVYVIR